MSTVLGSPQDYVGRVYDVLAFSGVKPTGDVPLDELLFSCNSSGLICTGVQKLAQRFVLEFLTEVGSIPYAATRGCQFMTSFYQGLLQTEADVFTEFDFSLIDIKTNLQGEQSATQLADECFASAQLLSVTILPGYLQLSVQVNSVAGPGRQVILPLATDY